MQGCYAFKGNKEGVVIYEVLTQEFSKFRCREVMTKFKKQGDLFEDKDLGYALRQV